MKKDNFELVAEGEKAFMNHKKVRDCPYQHKTEEAYWWRTGWYDERTRNRLGWLFDKYGVSYP